MFFGDRHSEPMKATYTLSEVKSFVTNYDPSSVGAFDLDFSIQAGNDRSDIRFLRMRLNDLIETAASNRLFCRRMFSLSLRKRVCLFPS